MEKNIPPALSADIEADAKILASRIKQVAISLGRMISPAEIRQVGENAIPETRLAAASLIVLGNLKRYGLVSREIGSVPFYGPAAEIR